MEHYGILIKKLDKVFKQNFNQELERVGLTFSQMRVLRFIEDNPKMKITQKDISNELDIQHSTTIGLLKRMQEWKGEEKLWKAEWSNPLLTKKRKLFTDC